LRPDMGEARLGDASVREFVGQEMPVFLLQTCPLVCKCRVLYRARRVFRGLVSVRQGRAAHKVVESEGIASIVHSLRGDKEDDREGQSHGDKAGSFENTHSPHN
jgi:hypothetical protein